MKKSKKIKVTRTKKLYGSCRDEYEDKIRNFSGDYFMEDQNFLIDIDDISKDELEIDNIIKFKKNKPGNHLVIQGVEYSSWYSRSGTFTLNIKIAEKVAVAILKELGWNISE